MRVTENNNYWQYLQDRLITFFSEVTNYIYVGVIILAFGLYWHKHGLGTTLMIFTLIANAFTVTFLLTEILITLMYKEFKRNRYITYFLMIATLTTINIIYSDSTGLYWSFVAGLIFLIPILIGVAFNKINFWKR